MKRFMYFWSCECGAEGYGSTTSRTVNASIRDHQRNKKCERKIKRWKVPMTEGVRTRLPKRNQKKEAACTCENHTHYRLARMLNLSCKEFEQRRDKLVADIEANKRV